jgi:AAA domain
LSGSTFEAAVLTLAGTDADPATKPKPKKLLRKIPYEYRDPQSGETRYRKLRSEYGDGSKSFVFDPTGRNGCDPLLYGGERIADLAEGQPLFVVEGEKCVERLRELGAVAVSGDTGDSSKWLPNHAGLLRNLNVILWPDSDKVGEKYIANAARCLEGHAASVRVVRPFGLPNGSKGRDVCDWHGDADALLKLVEGAERYAPAVQETKAAQDFTQKVKRGGDFLAEYTPIRYTFDGLLPCGSFYALTGKTGSGKTCFAQALTLSALSDRNLIGFDPEPG